MSKRKQIKIDFSQAVRKVWANEVMYMGNGNFKGCTSNTAGKMTLVWKQWRPDDPEKDKR